VVAAGAAGTASAADQSSHSALGKALARSASAHTVTPNMNHNK
jgi:hypothetical protein